MTVNGRKALRIQFVDTRHFRAEQFAHALEVMDGDGETYFVVSFVPAHQILRIDSQLTDPRF